MKNAKLVLSTGTQLYEANKKGGFLFWSAAIMLVLLPFLSGEGEFDSSCLLLQASNSLLNCMVFLMYIALLIGIGIRLAYFVGLLLMALGEIAVNTCPDELNDAPVIVKPAVSQFQINVAKRGGNWICSSCGEKNRNSVDYCENCGMNK